MASLTRKDFENIAAAVKRTRVSGEDAELVYGKFTADVIAARVDGLADDLARVLAGKGQTFDRRRFLEACGVEDVGALDARKARLDEELAELRSRLINKEVI